MDHFAGLDDLLRCVFGREKSVSIYGPRGMIDAVEHKLKAYSWNLIAGYQTNPLFCVAEVDESGRLEERAFPGSRVSSARNRRRRLATTACCWHREPAGSGSGSSMDTTSSLC
jgi:ribonuclease Z